MVALLALIYRPYFLWVIPTVTIDALDRTKMLLYEQTFKISTERMPPKLPNTQ